MAHGREGAISYSRGKESQTTTKRGCAGGKEMRAPIIEEAKRK
jgi:hypothetical protein